MRVGLYVGCKIYYVREGYAGLITGGENIIEASWESVSSIIHKVGYIRTFSMELGESRIYTVGAAKNLHFHYTNFPAQGECVSQMTEVTRRYSSTAIISLSVGNLFALDVRVFLRTLLENIFLVCL